MKKHRYLVSRLDCPVIQCNVAFITKTGFLAHMKRKHGFTKEQLEFPRRFLLEVTP